MNTMIKSVRVIGFTLILIFLTASGVFAADFSARADKSTYKPGDTIVITVNFSAAQINGAQADVTVSNPNGAVQYSGSTKILWDSDTPKDSVHTATIKLTAVKDGNATVTISNVKITTVTEDFTVAGSKPVSINVATPAPTTPKPTTPTTPKPTTPTPTTPVVPEVNPMDKAVEVTIGEAKWYLWPELINVTLPAGFEKGESKYKDSPIQVGQRQQVLLAYLTDGEGKNGTFWTFNAQTQEFYPYVALQSSGSYVLLQPGADVALPEGYETTTTFELDGRTVNGWKSEDEAIQNFVLVYAMNIEGKEGFYYYDIQEKTMQRFGQRIVEVEVIVEPEPEPIIRQIFGNPILAGIFSGLGLLAAGLAAGLIHTIQKYKNK